MLFHSLFVQTLMFGQLFLILSNIDTFDLIVRYIYIMSKQLIIIINIQSAYHVLDLFNNIKNCFPLQLYSTRQIIIQIKNKTMTIVSKLLYWINKFLRKVDLFPTTSFVRYNAQDAYQTATGGAVSVAVLIIFIILFASMGLRTIDRQIISASVSIVNDAQPPALIVETSPQKNFMFAVSLFGFNLSDTTYRLFNITLRQNFYGPLYQFISSRMIPLAPCTAAHFAFGSDIQSFFQNFHVQMSLCPPIDQKFQVGGKIVSNLSNFQIQVEKCNSQVDPRCVNDTVISQFEQAFSVFTLVIPVINVQLNPGNSDYKYYYLEDRNYFQFNSKLGMASIAELQQVVVNTDMSIMPFTNIQTENFTVIPNRFLNTPYIVTPSRPYATVTFNKASTTTTYDRSFNKVDSYFSYVGGLIGTILGLIFILEIYTKTAYEVSISHKLFKDSEGKAIDSGSFNIFTFLLMGIKTVLSLCKCNISWPKTQTFIDCCEEMNFQLDITYILKRLMFLQSVFEVLLEKQHLNTLHFKEKSSIDSAKQQRMKHFEFEMIRYENSQSVEKKKSKANQIYEQNIGQGIPKPFPQKQQNNIEDSIQQMSDFSALSISQRSRQNQDLRFNLLKVFKESKRGDPLSKKVIQRVDKKFLSEMKLQQDNQDIKQAVKDQINLSVYEYGIKIQQDNQDIKQEAKGQISLQVYDYGIKIQQDDQERKQKVKNQINLQGNDYGIEIQL